MYTGSNGLTSEADSWTSWFDENAPALTLFARQFAASHVEAEDLVQEAFVRFWKHGPHRVNDPRAYLFQCVKRSALDALRQQRRRTERESTVAQELRTDEAMFCESSEQKEQREILESAMRELPSEQREVMVLKVWGELTFPQIGEVLEIPTNTAASRYRYALAALRKRFQEEEVR